MCGSMRVTRKRGLDARILVTATGTVRDQTSRQLRTTEKLRRKENSGVCDATTSLKQAGGLGYRHGNALDSGPETKSEPGPGCILRRKARKTSHFHNCCMSKAQQTNAESAEQASAASLWTQIFLIGPAS